MIIGITGTNGSGKDTVASLLVKKLHWPHYSLSDEIRQVAKERSLSPTRQNLIKLGNTLRQEFGASYLSNRIMQNISDNFIATSIRNPEEINPFKQTGKFVLITVDAPIELRYQRIIQNSHRTGQKVSEEKSSFTEFKQQEQSELTGNKFSQQLNTVIGLADVKIANDGTIEELEQVIDKFLSTI